ncbi:dTDP-4-dehydrorhamnose reductase [Rhizorhabdus phycosphaerae]|uniref:dTDP-4-dehydrorhamnose reductase n=1 Tax=Rhizorhabdus phycosphaerae TaxID=2711156 RepID=UPI0013ED0308|nr:dTDP-4-dehydrorhamnose reductase [Rhizorhabdus phycosphaerae]
MTRHILVTGGQGQVGLEIARLTWPDGIEVQLPTRAELDIASRHSVAGYFDRHPVDAIVNCAAYTAVDRAEEESELAFRVNGEAPGWLAEAGVPIVHLSTDYVFDGSKSDPYDIDDPVAPLGVYGASKLAGERAVLAGGAPALVLRTAWVLSAHRNNFLKTMLRVAANTPRLRVVDDQRGCPTAAADIAEAVRTILIRMMEDPQAPFGVQHFVNAGEASWCELAREIFRLSAARGGPVAEVEAITTTDYPTPARRPANSRLSTAALRNAYAIEPRRWQLAVNDIIEELLGPPVRNQGTDA